MQYGKYLKTTHWIEIRATILERDCYKCRLCGEKYDILHVHHNTYKRLGHENLTDLITLCQKCHRSIHGKVTAGEIMVDTLISQAIQAMKTRWRMPKPYDLRQSVDTTARR